MQSCQYQNIICAEEDIVIELFIYALMLIYSDVIMCYGRYVITSI